MLRFVLFLNKVESREGVENFELFWRTERKLFFWAGRETDRTSNARLGIWIYICDLSRRETKHTQYFEFFWTRADSREHFQFLGVFKGRSATPQRYIEREERQKDRTSKVNLYILNICLLSRRETETSIFRPRFWKVKCQKKSFEDLDDLREKKDRQFKIEGKKRSNQRERTTQSDSSDGIDMPGRYWGLAAAGNSTEASGWSRKNGKECRQYVNRECV